MIPKELQDLFDESEELKNGEQVNPATIITHATPQGRVKTLQIRLTDQEYQQLSALAGDKPISSLARSLLFTAVRQYDPHEALADQALKDALAQAGYTLTTYDNKAA